MRLTLFWVVILGGYVLADGQDINTVKQGQLDFNVPDSPAFTALGVTPETVTRPTTPRDFATGLLNGVDENGNLQTGVAIDTAPYMLFYGDKVSLHDYQGHDSSRPGSWTRFSVLRNLARTEVSIGTTKGTTDSDKSSKIGLGFHFTPFDKGDPRLDFGFLTDLVNASRNAKKQFDKDWCQTGNPCQSGEPLLVDDDVIEKYKAALKTAIQKKTKDLYDAARKRWKRSAWVIAVAPTWTSTDGTFQNAVYTGTTTWSTVSYGFEGVPGLEGNALIVGHVRFRDHELAHDAQDATKTFFQRSLLLGGRVLVGGANTHGSFETAYVTTHPLASTAFLEGPEQFLKLTFGAEHKIAENLWVNIGVGGESGRKNNQNKLLIMSAFKWGKSNKAQYQAP
jgi:hypothetical protein